eukprot:UN10616
MVLPPTSVGLYADSDYLYHHHHHHHHHHHDTGLMGVQQQQQQQHTQQQSYATVLPPVTTIDSYLTTSGQLYDPSLSLHHSHHSHHSVYDDPYTTATHPNATTTTIIINTSK